MTPIARHGGDGEPVALEIRCPADTRVLGPLRAMATAVAVEQGFPDDDVAQIEMAVDEACANAVRHAYGHVSGPRTGCLVSMRVEIASDALRFRVSDNGIGLANMPAGAASVEEYVERGGTGGLGIFIIRNFMDEVEYEEPLESGTTVTMTKYLRRAAAEAR